MAVRMITTAIVGFMVKVAEQQDEGECISDEDILHPTSERAASQDGIQAQHNACRELDLCYEEIVVRLKYVEHDIRHKRLTSCRIVRYFFHQRYRLTRGPMAVRP